MTLNLFDFLMTSREKISELDLWLLFRFLLLWELLPWQYFKQKLCNLPCSILRRLLLFLTFSKIRESWSFSPHTWTSWVRVCSNDEWIASFGTVSKTMTKMDHELTDSTPEDVKYSLWSHLDTRGCTRSWFLKLLTESIRGIIEGELIAYWCTW